ncbi:MAG: beta strand repeat-containing protein, partial [Minisyncoccia bacterium]
SLNSDNGPGGVNNAQLRFSVNGTLVGTTAVLTNHGENSGAPDNWIRFYGNWTSGPTATTADIYINDLQAALGGNDFGLDDISFGTLSTFVELVSAPGTDAQTVCANTPITDIIYSVGSTASGPTITGLPAGLTTSFNGIYFTISGTSTAPAGTYTYKVTTTGTCIPSTATGTITIQSQGLALASGSNSPTICANTPVNIGYTLTGTATGASSTGLPAGVNLSVAGTVVTISGMPAVAGSYPYTITTSGTCAPVTVSGTITVQQQTITLNSANKDQTVCINQPISNIQFTVGGTATGASVSGLPAGVTGTYNSGFFIISGTPTASGTFTYIATTSGTCAAVTATGTITVTPAASLNLSSGAGSDAQVACNGAAIADITYVVNNGSGASVSGLPAGVTGSYAGGVFTITGTPTTGGTYTYTVTTSGGCTFGTATGIITVNAQTVTLSSGSASPTVCVNTGLPSIVYTIGGTATSATVSGLPAGVGYTLTGASLTINGTPTTSGSFSYIVTTSGTCGQVTANGTITVQPAAIGGTVSSVSICNGASGSLTITGQTGAIV